MTTSLGEQAGARGWKLKSIETDCANLPQPVDFSDFDKGLVAVSNYIRVGLSGTNFGISGAEDYTKSPRNGITQGLFSIYDLSHSTSGSLKISDRANVLVVSGGEIYGVYPYSADKQNVLKDLLGKIGKIRVTKSGTLEDCPK